MLAKLLPERHNLYGNSLDFKLNIYYKKKKIGSAKKKDFENSDQFSGMCICVKLVKSLAGRSRNIVCNVFVAEEIWRFDCSQTQINLVSDNFTAICDQVIT